MSTTLATELSIADRVSRLRTAMAQQNLSAYVIPSPDPHQSEYVPEPWQRRAWISGFTGSAGTVVVQKGSARVWADSRYWLQAEAEIAGTPFTLEKLGSHGVQGPLDWLEANVEPGSRVGVDPQVFTLDEWNRWSRQLTRAGAELVAVEQNLVDELWEGQPPLPAEPLLALPVELAGRTTADKLAWLRAEMAKVRCKAHVITTLDSIAWLYNVRGRDVDYNPVAISYAVVTTSEATLLIDSAKVTPEVGAALKIAGVRLRPYDQLPDALAALGEAGARVWVDPQTVSRWVADLLRQKGATLYERESPIVLAKALKNPVELAGMRACHVRDGAAVCRFLRWLEDELAAGKVLDEIDASDRLEAFRAEGDRFQGLSFATISGYGPNGAVVHYRASPKTARRLERRSLYLVDSGAQYLDGTTDITRTIALGAPSPEQRDRFTRVLRGHIALAMARFPAGSKGSELDPLARKPLWDASVNYGHGTGHGVGHFLCVHEGPAGIAPRSTAASLAPGMVLSNEPGYYKAGEYGIRIENLIEVVERGKGPDGDAFLGFETLTVVPIDTRVVEAAMLAPEERTWLNRYHAMVRDKVTPLLREPADRKWLEQATAPV